MFPPSSVITTMHGLTIRQIPASTQIQRQAGFAKSTGRDRSRQQAPATNSGISQSNQSQSSQISYLDQAADLYADFAGVNEISRLKSAVSEASSAFDSSTSSLLRLRDELEQRVSDHERLERLHHNMMQRRHEWGVDGDVDAAAEDFARLTAEEGRARRLKDETKLSLREAEENLRMRQVEYMDAMRKRYHEEQVWQDKWRVLGTYGTWALIGLNSIIFLGGQILHFKREEDRLSAIAMFIDEMTRSIVERNTEVQSVGKSTISQSTQLNIDNGEGQQVESDKLDAPQSESESEASSQVAERSFSVDLATNESDRGRKTEKTDMLQKGFHSADMKLSPIVSELHWPSAAVGAIVASLAILVLSSTSRR
mmetsp:Transcript_10560/g.31115  ORF Transcript_10560/g.31115 Transcript_10560/m.31115 type:complete len:368 (-) Transcript_10560:401-1504(-)